jgi:hypothetical protein
MADKIKISVLEDGTIKTETDRVSLPNHANAEGFLREILKLAGGTIERRNKHGVTTHSHHHGQDFHSHEEHHH